MTFSNITANSVLVDWSPAAGATLYNIKRRAVGTTAWTNANTTADQFQLAGLAAGTVYQVQIRTKCGTAWFPFSPIYTFQTAALRPGENSERADFQEIENFSNENLKIYPNPANGSFFLKFFNEKTEGEEARLEIFNTAGQLIFNDLWQMDAGENQFQIEIGDWQPGVFSVRVLVGEKLEIKQFVVF